MATYDSMREQTEPEANSLEETSQLGAKKQAGRRAAQSSLWTKLPHLNLPQVLSTSVQRPVIAAGVAIAGFVGVTAAATTGQSVSDEPSLSTSAEGIDLRDLAGAQEITIAASDADATVMEAAEVLNAAAALEGQSRSVKNAAADLEKLLGEIAEKAGGTQVQETGRVDVASRSFARESVSNADTEQAEEVAGQLIDAAEEVLGISIRANGTNIDLPVLAEDDAKGVVFVDEEVLIPSAVQDVKDVDGTATYVGKHAQDEPTQEAQELEDSSQSTNAVDLPNGASTVTVEVGDSKLEEVVAATAKLRALIEGKGSPDVLSAQEYAKTQLEGSWEDAVKLANSIGTYSNGQIPLSAMTEIATASGHFLRDDAAIMFAELNSAFKERFGRNIMMTDSYRSYGSQVATKASKGWLAASPGTSNHGWGLALDLSGPEAKWNTAERNWLVSNGSDYGWISPEWANTTKPEPWHWEFAGASVSAIAPK